MDITKTMLGCAANTKHCILLKHASSESWYLPLAYFPRSAAILWPVKVIEWLLGTFIAEPETMVVDPWVTAITTWPSWEAWGRH
eukprot:4765957-Amphidinium_carterae.5